jgi:type II restriction/modification system DNA methylase subunit YeeA
MNKSALKKYAPQAREDFIGAVTRRAETLGLNPDNPGTVEHNGDAMLINGQPFPAALKRQRDTLQERIAGHGFGAVMDATAYTWFNRLVAIRYMELHDFLGHGYRVLSHPQGHAQPKILDHVADLEMPGLDRQHALELKLAGNRDEELYREVLLAQCHALHTAMPFLFESIDDATELLLPDGLLRTDSLIRELVTAIDEASWQDVEIIGWLYQFYISEKKSQVIGKVVKSEDIPAATQLFTPNWIVKYLVQNSLGRLWLMANPTSTLASQWDYYIEPAEQTPEVNAQLDELIQTRIEEDGNTLNPESLTLLDPACGSGHILVEAYDLLRDIYLERGYRRRDIPRLILEKNLYGLDIDDRAAQLAGFALLMSARADDRRLFHNPVRLNVHALQQPTATAADLHAALNDERIDYKVISQLVDTFAQAKMLGSLIQIPAELAQALPRLQEQLEALTNNGGLFADDAATVLLPLVTQARILARRYDAVVANPPYMGSKGMNAELKTWAKKSFPASKADLFAMFIERGFGWCKASGFNSMVTMQSWMFLSSYEQMRTQLLEDRTISTLAHLGARAFSEISGEVVQTTAFALQPKHIAGFRPAFFRLVDDVESAKDKALRTNRNRFDSMPQDDFKRIPGSPVAYWARSEDLKAFGWEHTVGDCMEIIQGMITGNNEKYIRYWHEVSVQSFSRFSGERRYWVPYNKGGGSIKWYGNHEKIIDWRGAGRAFTRNRSTNSHLYFRPYVSWSYLNSGGAAARYYPEGFIWDVHGSGAFPTNEHEAYALVALLCSSTGDFLLKMINPTMSVQVENISALPWKLSEIPTEVTTLSRTLVDNAKKKWDEEEYSWDFAANPIVAMDGENLSIIWSRLCVTRAGEKQECKEKEQAIDLLIADAYKVRRGVGGSAPIAQPRGLDCSARFSNTVSIVSYAIGCMMGRYSLDVAGLIYAHAGNEGFDPSQYKTFPADADGIVPITDEAWFDDDGANRIREFVRVVWGAETESENMSWLAESLGTQRGESADDTIRRYLSKQFYKDHLQTYKKRPIYWLFSSGKQKAFEALVYLHRYNAGTLSRMRMEYVVPLQSRMQSRIDSLEQDIPAAASSAETKRLQKQRGQLVKQLDELRRFDESLRHYADQRITLDLDDGVKVNYGKFGHLLADVKAVTGKKPAD